jgi:hypothetical protein
LQDYYFSNNAQAVSKNNLIRKRCVNNKNPFSRAHAVGGFKSNCMYPVVNIDKIKP